MTHGVLKKWISDFAEGFSKKETIADIENTEQEIITATINIEDLPDVMWNDEKFYVLINPDTKIATIYNKFTFQIKEIENVNTIEEVDNILNGNEVVKAEEEIELEKTSGEDEIDEDEIDQSIKEDYIACPICNRNLSNCDCEMESLEDQINTTNTIMDLTEKISKLEIKLSELSNEITAIKAQEYARKEPEGIYSEDRIKAEIEHFNETARTTEEKIKRDSLVDITTPKGRVSLPLTQKTITELYKTPSDEVDRMSYNRDENIKKLNSNEADLFKTAICINNCSGKLIRSKCINNMLGVYCNKCNAEYAINLDNEDIYQKI